MPRTHNKITCSDESQIDCECDECHGNDLIDKYPDLLRNFFTAKEVAEIWISFSEQACAGWLYDDRTTVYQVFKQAPEWIKQGKPDNFYWRTGTEFK